MRAMKTSRIATLLLFSLLPTMVPATAFAQDDAVTTQARARFKEGVDAYDKGQYENARLAFLQAYALKKHPAVLLNLAQSSAKSNHPLEAARYFQQFLKESTSPTPQQQRDAETGLAEVRQKLGRIEIIAPPGTEITLDDANKLGVTPFPEPVDVEVGPHALKSSTETVKVIATAGQKVQARFGSGTGAPVVVPVVPAESPPLKSPPPDTNAVGLTTEPPSDTRKTNLLSPPDSMVPVYLGLIVAGLGGAGAITFALFKSDAQTKADSGANDIRRVAEAQGTPSKGICNSADPRIQAQFGSSCKTLKDNQDKVDTDATIANISLVVMGVGLLTAGGWYLLGPKKESRAAASTTPVVTPYAGWGSAGFSVSGAF